MSTNNELYCPEVDSNSKKLQERQKYINTCTNAYMMNKELCKEIENTENKISCLEGTLKHAENQLKKKNQIVK